MMRVFNVFTPFLVSIKQVWTHQVNYRYSARIVDICTSKCQYGSSSYIFVSMADNTIHCLHRDTLKRVSTRHMLPGILAELVEQILIVRFQSEC